MNFIGKICPYCKTKLKEGDDVVVCSICEMPHHKECWIENKACTTFGCTGTIAGSEQYTEEVDNRAFCANCGVPLNEEQKFCALCGTPTGATGEPHFQVRGEYYANQSYQQNIYTHPQSHNGSQYFALQYNTGYNPYGQQQQQVDQDLYTFIQSNQMKYISKFQRMQISNTKASWNWSSFMFGGYWFAFRKMYGIAAAFIAIILVCEFIPLIGSMIQLALWICSGIFGNYFYKQYIDEELKIANDMEDFHKPLYIAKKGGTSTGAVFAAIGFELLFALIIFGM